MPAASNSPAATRWILWSALLAAVFTYAAIPLLVSPAAAEPALPALPGLLTAFGFAAAAGALAVHRLALRGPIARGALDPAHPEDAPRILVGCIVAWALAEVPALLGLGLALLGGGPRAGWGLALLSGVTLLALAPRFAPATPSSAALARPGVKIG